METLKEKVNVAPSSDEGHFVEGARTVIAMDESVTEAFYVKGKSKLTTKNHTDLNMDEDCLVNCQVAYNPLLKAFEKVRD